MRKGSEQIGTMIFLTICLEAYYISLNIMKSQKSELREVKVAGICGTEHEKRREIHREKASEI